MDDVILSCANQVGEDNRNMPGMANLLPVLSQTVPGATFNHLSGSGLEPVGITASVIKSGDQQLLIAVGVERMSYAHFEMGKASNIFS